MEGGTSRGWGHWNPCCSGDWVRAPGASALCDGGESHSGTPTPGPAGHPHSQLFLLLTDGTHVSLSAERKH